MGAGLMTAGIVMDGSQDNKHDRSDLHFFQNILMNGGVCGRRAFFGRFMLRAFGVPTTARHRAPCRDRTRPAT